MLSSENSNDNGLVIDSYADLTYCLAILDYLAARFSLRCMCPAPPAGAEANYGQQLFLRLT